MFSSRKAVLAFAALAATADQAAAFAPAAGSLRLRAPGHQVACQSGAPTRSVAAKAKMTTSLQMGNLGEKYGHLRGAEIEPCGAAVERFYKLFGKPVSTHAVAELPWDRESVLARPSLQAQQTAGRRKGKADNGI
jgi:hypothetical protein